MFEDLNCDQERGFGVHGLWLNFCVTSQRNSNQLSSGDGTGSGGSHTDHGAEGATRDCTGCSIKSRSL